jgi:hypothetical protein
MKPENKSKQEHHMKFIDTRNSKQRKDPRKVVAVVRLEHDTAVVIAPLSAACSTPEKICKNAVEIWKLSKDKMTSFVITRESPEEPGEIDYWVKTKLEPEAGTFSVWSRHLDRAARFGSREEAEYTIRNEAHNIHGPMTAVEI